MRGRPWSHTGIHYPTQYKAATDPCPDQWVSKQCRGVPPTVVIHSAPATPLCWSTPFLLSCDSTKMPLHKPGTWPVGMAQMLGIQCSFLKIVAVISKKKKKMHDLSVFQSSLVRKRLRCWAAVVHAFNSSTWEAEAGQTNLQVSSKTGSKETLSRNKQTNI